MNILILNWRDPKNPKSGGAEKVTLEHAASWVKAGHNVVWFTSRFKNSKHKEEVQGVSIVRKGNYITVYLLAPIFYFFSKNKFDVVVDEIHGLPFFTPLYIKEPKIALIHEVAGPIWDYMFPPPINLIGKFIEPLYFKLYRKEKFWVPSKSTKDDLIKQGVDEENISLIYCGIDNEVLDKIPEKEDIPTFIFVSRVVKMKGVEEVIKSFFHILKVLRAANLWIVGDGDKEYVHHLKKTMNLYAISTKIKFIGRVSEIKKLSLMKKAHILLHASVKEGWGLVVIESASQATPAVVYDVGGLRDSVLNGKTGVVISQNSPEEMAKESIALIKDKRRYLKFQQNCLKWAGSIDWSTETKKSLKLIESLDSDYEKN